MISTTLKEQKIDIVLIGDFNPKIFHPTWFVYQGLLGKEEGESASIEVVHNDLAIFSLNWLRWEVTRNRVVTTTKFDHHYEALRDLIINTFTILTHTPLRMLGINNYYEYMVNSENEWHLLGNTLAPKSIWAKIMNNPGLRNLDIEGDAVSKENYRSRYTVTTGPARDKLSFKVATNYHFELISSASDVIGGSEILKILSDSWNFSQKRARDIGGIIFQGIE